MAIENINEIEQSLGIEAGKLTELINGDGNHKVDLSGMVYFKKSDYDSRINNLKAEEFKKGQEILLKEMKEEQGLEYEGRKDASNFVKAFKEKIEAESKIEPNQKYDTLKSDFGKLQNNYAELESKYNGLESNIAQERNDLKINSSILKEIPDNTTIPKEDILTIIRAKNSVRIGENGNIEILDSSGNVIKDQTTLNPLGVKEFLGTTITPYLKEPEGGKGGNDDKGQHSEGSFEAFVKSMESKDISEGSEEFNEEMMKRIEDGTLKI